MIADCVVAQPLDVQRVAIIGDGVMRCHHDARKALRGNAIRPLSAGPSDLPATTPRMVALT